MKPIPRSLLIHSVTHKTGKTKDAWGNDTWTTSTPVLRVRVEPTTKLVKGPDNTEVQLSLLMFHDCRNSSPALETYTVGDCVTWNGADHIIMTVDTLYDTKAQAHHLELGLV